LVARLRQRGYSPLATVEHDTQSRLSTVRLASKSDVKVDLLFASSGIEQEVVSRSTIFKLTNVGSVAVARAEELLAMKVLSMDDRRLQDQIDARRLVSRNPGLDLLAVRDNLANIQTRGYSRG